VLGNCLYDQDYLPKVTKIKPGGRRWDLESLHRHPSYGPIKADPESNDSSKEAVKEQTKEQESRPSRSTSVQSVAALAHEDDEYGDMPEDMDMINPDEVCLPAERSPIKQSHRPPEPRDVDRSSTGAIGQLVQLQHNKVPALQPPRQQTPDGLKRQGPAQDHPQFRPHPQPPQNMQPLQSRPGTDRRSIGASGPTNDTPQRNNQNQIPEPDPETNEPPSPGPGKDAPVQWYSPRVLLNGTSGDKTAAKVALNPFNPQAPFHSQTTNSVNYSRSAPIKRQHVGQAPPPAINSNITPQNRPNFVNPQADSSRKIGMPSGGVPSPLSNRTSYKPPGPAIGKRNAEAMNRSPLSDVSNIQNASDGSELKRQRIEDNGKATNSPNSNGERNIGQNKEVTK
jgi:DNA repair and recombination protein RAD52